MQENLLDDIEVLRSWVIELTQDIENCPPLAQFYKGMIVGYKDGIDRAERMYKKYYKHDLELLEEIKQRLPIVERI